MMLSTNNIFTVQADKEHKSDLVQIETLITNGLYRFTLLGMHSRHASDTKDRVYSALRSSNLLNLKSDNRKIIVNLTPDNTEKKEGIYDLGIALSILSCLDKNFPNLKLLVVGGLSISGKVTASNRIKQGIYTAYKSNIQYIICSSEDMVHIDQEDIDMLKHFDIFIVGVQTLHDAVEVIKSIKFTSQPQICKEEKKLDTVNDNLNLSELDPLTRALFISLCGGHHMIIQTSIIGTVKSYIENFCNMYIEKRFGAELYTAFKEKLLDEEIIHPNTYIENIRKFTKSLIQNEQMKYKNCLIASYTPCSCGYQYNFFEKNRPERKCICSQRTLLQYKRYIESNFFDIFNIHITNTETEFSLPANIQQVIERVQKIQFERYCKENKLNAKEIYLFPNNAFLNQYRDIEKIEVLMGNEAREIWIEHKQDPKVLRIAQTIQDILDYREVSHIKKPTLSKQALILALSYFPKMDF